MGAVLLAQCADPATCDIPRSLPWYFSLALIALWVAMVTGSVVLGLALIRARVARRRRRRPPPGTPSREIVRRARD